MGRLFWFAFRNTTIILLDRCRDVSGFSPIDGANGDMGENDTASFDPVFFFHHAHIDRMFWLWQLGHEARDTIEIFPGYPGTNSVDNQGPTPGVAPNSWLNI